MNLVNLSQYRNRELVAVLRDLLKLAEDGDARGLAFVVKIGNAHRAGAVGDYRRSPEEALSATFRMERHLMHGQPPHEETAT